MRYVSDVVRLGTQYPKWYPVPVFRVFVKYTKYCKVYYRLYSFT